LTVRADGADRAEKTDEARLRLRAGARRALRPSSARVRWSALSALSALFALSALSAPSSLSAQSVPADYSWRLERADGSQTTLESLRGQVLVINIWASWCVPCVTELPALERLADSLADSDVEFAAISVDKPAALQQFLVEHPVRLPIYREVDKPPKVFGLSIVPTTYVIDRAGSIVLHHRGAYDWDQAGLRVMLRALTHSQ